MRIRSSSWRFTSFVDFGHQLHGGLHALFIAVCGAGGNGLMVGYTYFVELFQVGRVYGYKVDALVQRQCIVFGFQQHAVVERQPADITFEISVFHSFNVLK